MVETLQLVDVVGPLVRYLTASVGVPFSGETPSTVPTSYGRVQILAGGSRVETIDSQPLLVRVWSDTQKHAWELARRTHDELAGLVGVQIDGVFILDLELTFPAWFPDPDTRGASFVFNATITSQAQTLSQ